MRPIGGPSPTIRVTANSYGSEQSLVNPQLRQIILQLRSYIRDPQISQSNPSPLGLLANGVGAAVDAVVRRSTMAHHLNKSITAMATAARA